MDIRRKLALLGAIAVIAVFVLLTFFQNWGKATAQRDIKASESAAKACIANPRVAARQCSIAVKEISAALPELERSDKKELTLHAQKTLAAVYMAMGKYEDAAKLYTKLAEADPQQSAPYRDVAQAYSMAGKHKAAMRYSNLAIQLAPDLWRAHRLHGHVLLRAHEQDKALAALQRAHELAPIEEQPAILEAIEKIRAIQPDKTTKE